MSGTSAGATKKETTKETAAFWAYRSAEWLAMTLPEAAGRWLFKTGGSIARARLHGVRDTVAANQARVLGVEPTDERVELATREAFELYARFWYDAFRIRSMPLGEFTRMLSTLLRDGEAPVDPVIRSMLPTQRSPWRSLDGYRRLVQHAGHAKMWRALIDLDEEPSYRELSATTGLSVNTLRNYRDQVLGELRLHGMDSPTMREMQLFARRCRPFLEPLITQRLG